MSYFLKYLPFIENTATYWCANTILRDLYGLEGDLSEDNWRPVNQRIAETSGDDYWPRTILTGRLGIQRCFCCVNEFDDTRAEQFRRKPFFSPHLEGFSFGPNYLESLISFIKHDDDSPPESLGSALDRFARRVNESLRQGIRSFGSAIDEDLAIVSAEDAEADMIYGDFISGREISVEQKHILISKFLYRFLDVIREKGVAQWYLGAAWKFGGRKGKYGYGESYVYVNHNLVPNLLKVFKDFPDVNFNLMYCSESLSQQLTIVARMLSNVSLLGFWWHNLFPSYVEKLISERIEALPANKWILTATDAYTCEWCYGKLSLVKGCLARVLARKVEEGYLTLDKAASLARRVLYDNPREIYHIYH
jgi:hypothetical protein